MKLVILDRDGVINEDSDEYIKSPDEFIPIPGSLHAIAQLKHANYTVVVATNQSGITRGLFDIETLNSIHAKLYRDLANLGVAIDGIFFCPHEPNDHCPCRKPAPGLFEAIGQRLRTDLKGVPAVGDSLRDIDAARVAGAYPILVKTGKGQNTIEQRDGLNNIPVFADLAAVVEALLEKKLAVS